MCSRNKCVWAVQPLKPNNRNRHSFTHYTPSSSVGVNSGFCWCRVNITFIIGNQNSEKKMFWLNKRFIKLISAHTSQHTTVSARKVTLDHRKPVSIVYPLSMFLDLSLSPPAPAPRLFLYLSTLQTHHFITRLHTGKAFPLLFPFLWCSIFVTFSCFLSGFFFLAARCEALSGH